MPPPDAGFIGPTKSIAIRLNVRSSTVGTLATVARPTRRLESRLIYVTRPYVPLDLSLQARSKNSSSLPIFRWTAWCPDIVLSCPMLSTNLAGTSARDLPYFFVRIENTPLKHGSLPHRKLSHRTTSLFHQFLFDLVEALF